MEVKYNPDYIHHQDSKVADSIREIVFGMEDGMVSTLGTITGIAVGSQNHFVVILAGLVIISVESISMGIGVYISNLSEFYVLKRKLYEEKKEIEEFPHEEKQELLAIYLKDGWPKDLATTMSETAAKDEKLMFAEMAHHELKIDPNIKRNSWHDGLFMFLAYIVGGLVPLFAYFILPIAIAIKLSIVITLIGLFSLGASTAKYTKGSWVKMGTKVLVLGGVALLVGYFIGTLASSLAA
ncbi:MAG: VIT1/CCC1 transporter family protein [Patescibacteria group bacterium]|jgi:VIT1/CCC1 family predicted Fe2+/Mn2+ transporter